MSQKSLYRPAIVAFIDLLGFEDLVEKEDSAKIKVILSKFQQFSTDEYVNTYASDKNNSIFESAVFSDSVVRINYLDHPAHFVRSYGAVFDEILAIAHALIELIPYGILPRGGITAGDIHVDTQSNQFFGPALIDAVKMESMIEPPCIAIDEVLMDVAILPSVNAAQNTAEQETEFIENMLSDEYIEKDGCKYRYIDPFKSYISEADFPEEWLIKNKRDHFGRMQGA